MFIQVEFKSQDIILAVIDFILSAAIDFILSAAIGAIILLI
jgi:hypothetical protein